LLSRNLASTNSAGPGVGERTIEPPFGVTGECMRQNGPSMLWSVSVVPWSPLLMRQTSADSPSEPAISTASLWDSLLCLPMATI
jgi:hypothetical protein